VGYVNGIKEWESDRAREAIPGHGRLIWIFTICTICSNFDLCTSISLGVHAIGNPPSPVSPTCNRIWAQRDRTNCAKRVLRPGGNGISRVKQGIPHPRKPSSSKSFQVWWKTICSSAKGGTEWQKASQVSGERVGDEVGFSGIASKKMFVTGNKLSICPIQLRDSVERRWSECMCNELSHRNQWGIQSIRNRNFCRCEWSFFERTMIIFWTNNFCIFEWTPSWMNVTFANQPDHPSRQLDLEPTFLAPWL
jgi:hypothetical protein